MEFDLIEQWLEDEAGVKVPGLDPMDRARFHKLVRESARNWLGHPGATIRPSRGKYGMALQFEGPVDGRQISLFALRAHHQTADYRFVGPNAERRKLGLKDESLVALDRLRALYEAVLGSRDGGGEAITAVISGGRGTDLVPLVEETRRALDGGGDLPVPGAPESPPKKKKKPESKPKEEGAEDASSPSPEPRRVALATIEDRTPVTTLSDTAPKPAPSEPESRSFPARMEFAATDPGELATFYGRILKLKPQSSNADDGVFLLDLGGFELRFRPDLDKDERKRLGYGAVEKHRGWGSRLSLRVSDFELALRRARRLGTAIESEDLARKRFQIRDPAGYLVEICDK